MEKLNRKPESQVDIIKRLNAGIKEIDIKIQNFGDFDTDFKNKMGGEELINLLEKKKKLKKERDILIESN